MSFNQEELDQWTTAAKQKEEDSFALAKYTKADETKIRDLTLALEKLTMTLAERCVVVRGRACPLFEPRWRRQRGRPAPRVSPDPQST